MPNTVAEIVSLHRSGAATPQHTVRQCFARIRQHDDPGVFIALRAEADAVAEAAALPRDPGLPLYGVPVAVKDNIDVQGLPTSAGCPAFTYRPQTDASAVARLRAAGAIVIGKTNLDQFATGLVGTRTPFPIPRNPLRADLIPGGSSSGSAVAVAAGLVPIALGTDTAGSGRVPAMLNNIVGLKPSLGLVSSHGVVPACRTLDCVSIFALTVDDAWTALSAIAGPDADDPYSRPMAIGRPGAVMPHLRVGVPRVVDRIFFGDERAERDFAAALDRLTRLGVTPVEIDMRPFYEAARLLYEGPWVAERYAAVRSLLEKSPDALHPVTRDIILGGGNPKAFEAFESFYRLQDLRATARDIWDAIDVLAVPTAPTVYTLAEVAADPVRLNSRLGTYTNFVNLLDLCGLALPAALHGDGRPSGLTLLAPSGSDALLASLGRVFHADTGLALGASDGPQPPLAALPNRPGRDEIAVAVVGAHMSGMPLNGGLKALGARFLERCETAPDYRLFALPGGEPARPGLLRIASGAGVAVEAEVWALPIAGFGRLVGAVVPPLSIGTLRLAGGREVKGFLVEAEGVADAEDISDFGGWRAFMEHRRLRA